jgi:hypothetical protein
MKDETRADNPKPTNASHPASVPSAISAQAGPTVPFNQALGGTQPFPWPYEPDQSSPLAWRRRLPPDSLRDRRFQVGEVSLE